MQLPVVFPFFVICTILYSSSILQLLQLLLLLRGITPLLFGRLFSRREHGGVHLIGLGRLIQQGAQPLPRNIVLTLPYPVTGTLVLLLQVVPLLVELPSASFVKPPSL